jgi:hypothetical protein
MFGSCSETSTMSFLGVRDADESFASPSNTSHEPDGPRQDVLEYGSQTYLEPFHLIEVELSDLKQVGKDIAQILGQRLRIEATVKGKLLLLPDEVNGRRLGVKDVKLQLKHALHNLGLSEEYRVLAEHHRIRIVKVEEKQKMAERKGTTPPPSQSLPYFFP